MHIDEAVMRILPSPSRAEQPHLPSAGKAAKEEQLLTACREFEAIFLNMMLKQMRGGIEEGGFMEKSHARKLFEEMHDEELSKAMSKGNGIGLAQQLYQQLTTTRRTIT